MRRNGMMSLALAAALAWGGSALAGGVAVKSGGQLSLDGTSTARAFTCKAKAFDPKLTPGAGSLKPAELGQAVTGVQLELLVAQLDCGNGTMNDHMRDALKAKEFKVIRYALGGYSVGAQAPDGRVPLKLKGELELAGQKRPVELTAMATPAADGSLRVQGSYALKMTEWGVKPPSLMFGAMKVGEVVTIKYDFTLVPPAAPGPQS